MIEYVVELNIAELLVFLFLVFKFVSVREAISRTPSASE